MIKKLPPPKQMQKILSDFFKNNAKNSPEIVQFLKESEKKYIQNLKDGIFRNVENEEFNQLIVKTNSFQETFNEWQFALISKMKTDLKIEEQFEMLNFFKLTQNHLQQNFNNMMDIIMNQERLFYDLKNKKKPNKEIEAIYC